MNNTKLAPKVDVVDWGQVDYKEAWDRQSDWHKTLVEQKRRGEGLDFNSKLVICEHKPVFTLGKSGSEDHLKWQGQELEDRGVDFYKINRGGDITHHGPGQLVIYPIFDLDQFFRDVHLYVRNLEEVIIRLMSNYDIQADRIRDYTGVWIKGQPNRKICAIGVHLSRWVSMHGLALNVNNDLSYFDGIVPCGIQENDKTITSVSKEIGQKVDMHELKVRSVQLFQDIFAFEIEKNELER